jgi:hypothetical protein
VVQKLGHSVEVCPKTAMQRIPETAEGATLSNLFQKLHADDPWLLMGFWFWWILMRKPRAQTEKLQQ